VTDWTVLCAAIALLGMAAPARADWVVAGFIGGAATQAATLRIEQPALGSDFEVRDVAFAGRSFASPVYYGYRILWAGPRQARVGFEAELIHLKVYADAGALVPVRGTIRAAPVDGTMRFGEVVERFSISHGLNLLFGNLVLRQPIVGAGPVRDRRVVLAVRLGAGPTIPHAESTIGGRTQEQYEWGRVAGQIAAGVEYRVTAHLAAIAEYKVTATRQRVAVPDGSASASFTTQHAVAGIAWRL
jgi:opacity protein-like surface antigen